jgi:hypothetical protein
MREWTRVKATRTRKLPPGPRPLALREPGSSVVVASCV